MWEDDDFGYQETEQERTEREAREREERVATRIRQYQCQHANYVETGHGVTVSADGTIFDYVEVWCPDCDHRDELDRAAWQSRTRVPA